MEAKKILKKVKKDRVRFVQLQFTDLLGITKSLTIPSKKLPDSIANGTWFDGSSIEGFARIVESDMFLKPDLNTYAVIPWLNAEEGNTARFICDVYKSDGSPFAGDPRYILKKALAQARDLELEYYTGPELEFFLFKKENSVIKPLPHDHGSYFDLTTDQAYNIRKEMTITLENFGIEVETSHHEVALGQHEISFKYNKALQTADNATTLRFVLKAIAQKYGLHATFMPKPLTGINGSGMHVHQSLLNTATGQNAFYNEKDKYQLSKAAYNFIAGQLKHIKGMSAILSPTVNSYKRLVPGYEAPVYISWARINRSSLIRVPMCFTGKTESTRVELRCPDPSCNIYLAFAVMLQTGLDGIRNNLSAPEPVEENLYNFDDSKLQKLNISTLPYSLWQAIKELKANPIIKEALGKHTFDRYIEAKTREWDEFRLHVSEWEIDRYLSIY